MQGDNEKVMLAGEYWKLKFISFKIAKIGYSWSKLMIVISISMLICRTIKGKFMTIRKESKIKLSASESHYIDL